MGFGSLIKGFFLLADIFKRVMIFLQLRAAKEEGRVEERLEQSEATVEVLARNAEGQQGVDNMTEEELNAFLKKK